MSRTGRLAHAGREETRLDRRFAKQGLACRRNRSTYFGPHEEAPMDDLDMMTRYPVARRRLSVADFYRLGEAGILNQDDRVELIEGQLIALPPVGTRHALAVDALTDLLGRAATPPARVRVQNPVTLNGASEPLPDIAVVRRPWRGYPGRIRDRTISFCLSRSPIPPLPSIGAPNAPCMLGLAYKSSGLSI